MLDGAHISDGAHMYTGCLRTCSNFKTCKSIAKQAMGVSRMTGWICLIA